MRDMFPGYYDASDVETKNLWDKCLFVPDTNILLNLYLYNSTTRADYLKVLEALKERLWLPHQIGLEYHRNRFKAAREGAQPYDVASIKLNEFAQEVRKSLNPFLVDTDAKDIEKKINDALKPVKDHVKDLKKSHQNFLANDTILPQITALFSKRVGMPYTQEKLNEIFDAGSRRYSNHVPPGYEDAAKDSEQRIYGDLIIWHQIMDKASADKIPIIFITADDKEDWWDIRDGKIYRPRPELIHEFRQITGMEFGMYSAKEFLQEAGKYTNSDPQPTSAAEVERIATAVQQQEEANTRASEDEFIDLLPETPIRLAHVRRLSPREDRAKQVAYKKITDQILDAMHTVRSSRKPPIRRLTEETPTEPPDAALEAEGFNDNDGHTVEPPDTPTEEA